MASVRVVVDEQARLTTTVSNAQFRLNGYVSDFIETDKQRTRCWYGREMMVVNKSFAVVVVFLLRWICMCASVR